MFDVQTASREELIQRLREMEQIKVELGDFAAKMLYERDRILESVRSGTPCLVIMADDPQTLATMMNA